MVTGGINILSNVSATPNSQDNAVGVKNLKNSSKMDFQSMFTNTADNAKTNDVKQQPVEKPDNMKDYNSDKSNVKVKNAPDDTKSITDVKDEIEEMCEEIKNVIKDKLGISDEELEEILDDLMMSMADLLDPKMCMQLMMDYSDVNEPMEIITDAKLSEMLKDINTSINNIVVNTSDKLNITCEDLKEFAKEYDELDFSKTFAGKIPEDNTEDVVIYKEAQNNTQSEEDKKDDSNKPSSEEKVNLETVITKLDDTVREVFEVSDVNEASPIDTEDVIRQINNAIKVEMSTEKTSMELTLNPENLGKVNIQVVSKNGVITANITTQDEAVRKAVEAQIVTLKENLNNQGIKVEAVSVTISGYSYAEGDGGREEGGHSNRRRNARLNLDDDISFDDKNDEVSDDNTSGTINYRA